jgi:hypothetical protein
MRRGVSSFVAAVVLATLCAGVVAVTSGAPIRPQEHAVAAELDNLHSARPVAAHFGRYLAGVRAAQELAWYQGVAAAQASQQARANQPAQATNSRRSTSAQPASGGADFFACVRHHESRGDYGVINRGSGAAGAYQFMPTTWSNAARAFGRVDLAGVNPAAASPADQDAVAHYVYSTQGARPWAGSGCF